MALYEVMVFSEQTVEVYEKHAEALISFATGLVGASEAEDVVAEAMMRVFTRVDMASVANPKSYLYRCVANQAASSRRGRARRLARERRTRPTTDSYGAESAVVDLGALSVLSVRERAAIYLTYWEDLGVAEVATRLDISDGTVRRLLARGRKKLREDFEQ